MKKILPVILLVTFLWPFSPATTKADYSSASAQNYLLAHSANAWSTLGLAALGTSQIPTDYLKNISPTGAIGYEAPILALAATGNDPKNFGEKNFVDLLEAFHSQNQLGDPQAVNDDIFGILALRSAGVNDAVVSDSKTFILAHQNSDGGWGFTTTSSSDSNTTASAIVALIAASQPASDAHIVSALNYLKQTQNSDGGFTYDPKSAYGSASDSSSTAWAIWALTAAGINPASWNSSGKSPLDYLKSCQTQLGFFGSSPADNTENSFSPTATAYAVIALAGKTLPLSSSSSSSSGVQDVGALFHFRIEGSANTMCAGQALGPTALDIVKNAAKQCNFSYDIKNTDYGPFLNGISGDVTPTDFSTGWMYLINSSQPSIGAADYRLKSGDDVLWYFGDYRWQPTRLSLSVARVDHDGTATAAIQYFDGTAWQNLSGATVYAGLKTAITGNDGTAIISAPDGYYQIFATRPGYIRSNAAMLQVGQPNSSSVSLLATVPDGEIKGTSTTSSLAFTLNTNTLDFGQLAQGSQISRQITVQNTGTVSLKLKTSVAGDDIFTSNLNLNNAWWKNFSGSLAASENQNLTVSLNLPQNYPLSAGKKTGQLIFWATAAD